MLPPNRFSGCGFMRLQAGTSARGGRGCAKNPVRDLAVEERGMPEARIDAASAGGKGSLRDASVFVFFDVGKIFF
jgi:hypothetical protein